MSDIDRGIRISSQGHIGIVELARGPHNFFDDEMIAAIAEGCEALEADATCRVIVLCAEGKSFCAGANFASPSNVTQARSPRQVNPIYNEALRLFACTKPIVCAVQGPAIGGGLGLALVGDFRVGSTETRFSANFNRLGIHPRLWPEPHLARFGGQAKSVAVVFHGQAHWRRRSAGHRHAG